jgi:hypothetical protein
LIIKPAVFPYTLGLIGLCLIFRARGVIQFDAPSSLGRYFLGAGIFLAVAILPTLPHYLLDWQHITGYIGNIALSLHHLPPPCHPELWTPEGPPPLSQRQPGAVSPTALTPKHPPTTSRSRRSPHSSQADRPKMRRPDKEERTFEARILNGVIGASERQRSRIDGIRKGWSPLESTSSFPLTCSQQGLCHCAGSFRVGTYERNHAGELVN